MAKALRRAFRLRGGDQAHVLEQGQGRIDDAGAGAIGPAETLLDGLDQLVAVTRLLGDQAEQNPAQVALLKEPAAPAERPVAAAAATEWSEWAEATAAASVAEAPRAVFAGVAAMMVVDVKHR